MVWGYSHPGGNSKLGITVYIHRHESERNDAFSCLLGLYLWYRTHQEWGFPPQLSPLKTPSQICSEVFLIGGSQSISRQWTITSSAWQLNLVLKRTLICGILPLSSERAHGHLQCKMINLSARIYPLSYNNSSFVQMHKSKVLRLKAIF